MPSVDLNLPSGNIWAKFPIGVARNAKTNYNESSDPTYYRYSDKCLYFQWGELKGYTAPQIKGQFNEKSYKFYNETNYNKYNASDNKKTLDEEDNVCLSFSDGWTIPTIKDFTELLDNTSFMFNRTENINDGGGGVRFATINNIHTSAQEPLIAFPLLGYACEGELINYNYFGGFWALETSDDVYGDDYYPSAKLFNLSLNNSESMTSNTILPSVGDVLPRYYGLPIIPVKHSKTNN